MPQSFTPLQLDGLIALWRLYNLQATNDPVPVSVKPRPPLPRREALTLFSIGVTIWKDFGRDFRLQS